MAMEIKVEKNIPIPKARHLGAVTEVIRTMEVGDSFVLRGSSYRSIHARFGQKGMKCVTRKIDSQNIRVWRVA